MLSVAKLSQPKDEPGKARTTKNNVADYWLNLARDDYYQKGGEPPGQWYGKGAESIGLEGKVTDSELRLIMDGYDPYTKEARVKSAGSLNKPHMPCWDLCFSAPKSVSVLWAVSDEASRQKIQELQQEAVNRTLEFIEEKVAKTRRGQLGLVDESPKGLIVATFEHSTSRAQDPLLHTHCLVANMAPRNDGSWGALEGKFFYDWKMASGAYYYRATLANLLQTEMGLSLTRDDKFFRITDVPKKIEKQFSQRRETIKKVMADPKSVV